MKKKIFALCLIAVLAATAVVGGTLAYFTDTEQANNTMVIGNIEINIEELTYKDEDGDGTPEWDKFEDDEFVLYPLKNELGVSLYNKMVYTYNTSSSEDDAYIRTIVLIEANDKITEEDETDCCLPGIHYFYDNATTGKDHGSKELQILDDKVTINNEEYWVVVFGEAEGKAIKHDESLQSLASVWIDENVTSDQIDGWGDNVEIIVFSQGIQATGLTHDQAMEELGEVNQANLTSWIKTEDAAINDNVYKEIEYTESENTEG